MKIRTIVVATCAAFAFSMASPIYAHDSEAQTVTKNFEAAIPNMPGKSLIAVEVDYAPGAASAAHTHAKSAFIGQARAGPNRRTRSIRSAATSKTEPAKLLAVFVLDTNDNPLTTPVK